MSRRPGADASAIEELSRTSAGSATSASTKSTTAPPAATTTPTEGEDSGALHEERPLFLVPGLEGREVHNRRVNFDLAEIGVQGGVQGNVGAEPVLQVHAHTVEEVGTVPEGVVESNVFVLSDLGVLGPAQCVG
jgi:hypothetical protein